MPGLEDIVDSVLTESGISPDGEVAAAPAPAAEPEAAPQEAAPEDPVPETTTEPEAPAEDPEIEVPGIGKMKASEIAALRQGSMLQSDYTRKTQELAAERTAVAARQAEFEVQQKQAAEQQQHQRQMQTHPLVNPDNWRSARLNEYMQQGWDPNDPGHAQQLETLIQRDLQSAQARALMDNQAQLVRELQRRDQVSQVETQRVQREQQTEALLAKPEHAQIRNEPGRNLVKAFMAQQQQEGKPVDVQGAVQAASAVLGQALKSYATTKQNQARQTGPILRGGGAAKAPDQRQFKGEAQELYDAADEMARGFSR